MKILFVTTHSPRPADSGGKIVSYNTIRHLRLRGHEVTEFPLVDVAESALIPASHDAASGIPVRPVRRTSFLRTVRALPFLPYPVARYWDERVCASLLSELEAGNYDLVHCDHLHTAGYGLRAKRELGTPIVLTAHNVEHVLWRGFSVLGWNVTRRLACRLESLRVRRYEAHVVAAFDACLALSEGDARSLSALRDGGTATAIPPGVDVVSFTPCPEREQAGAVVFCGRTDWPPNADGVLWFHRFVWPRIRQHNPDARLWIVGGNPPRAIRRLSCDPNVQVTGWVEDPREYLAMAQVVVVPLRIGSGVRIKILEALAMRRAVVSTPVGCQGLEVAGGEHIMIARDPEDFARKTLYLLSHPRCRHDLGEAGRTLIESQYTWEQAAVAIEQVYRRVRAERSGGGSHGVPYAADGPVRTSSDRAPARPEEAS